MTVTKEIIDKLKTEKGAWKAHVIKYFGYNFPPKSGWRNQIINSKVAIPKEDFEYLLKNKDKKLRGKKSILLNHQARMIIAKSSKEFIRKKKPIVKKALKFPEVWVKEFGLDVKPESTHKCTWDNRSRRLAQIGLTYPEYLKSKEWQRIKFRALGNPYYSKCCKCESTKDLHLHHRNYKWIGTKHAMSSIVRVCSICHNEIHKLARDKDIPVQLATRQYKCTKTRIPMHEVKKLLKTTEGQLKLIELGYNFKKTG